MTPDLPKIDYRGHPAYGGMFEPDPGMRDQAVAMLAPPTALNGDPGMAVSLPVELAE